jgi:hypothetical protein
MPQTKEFAGTILIPMLVPGQATAGTDDEWGIFIADSNLSVVGAKWTPKAAVTADATNYFTVNLVNRVAGAGSTSIATRAYSATNSVAMTPEDMTLSATAANLLISSGDLISVSKTHAGTGLAMPAGLVVVYVRRR